MNNKNPTTKKSIHLYRLSELSATIFKWCMNVGNMFIYAPIQKTIDLYCNFSYNKLTLYLQENLLSKCKSIVFIKPLFQLLIELKEFFQI